MDFFTAIKISGSGLNAQRYRLNVISSNLANAQTTRTPQGGPYRRKDVVFEAVPVVSPFHNALSDALQTSLEGVKVQQVVNDATPFKLVYDPGHPDADKDGYVKMPNVNTVEEMVNLINATRSYEANLAAIDAAKNMVLKALEIANR